MNSNCYSRSIFETYPSSGIESATESKIESKIESESESKSESAGNPLVNLLGDRQHSQVNLFLRM